ncbi:MAG: bifunctional diaminohydroxyphosphoribosylaminopyrimidine deaminase/5-amino-6-(5-phosphoribosylamino)uracil reductase RibD [Planctomycetota bacterium]
MNAAVELAWGGEGRVEPNPMVGCVLVRDGELIGEGYHNRFGGDHAEVAAIKDVRRRGNQTVGATAYVTLEPCCHHGKTPPCADALIQAGIQRVVIAVSDPFPSVDGGGIRRLTDAGLEVVTGVGVDAATVVLAPYLKRIRTGRPWTIAKWAMSLDGRIATTSGESQWITGAESRVAVHQLRSRVDAIAVGMGTVNSDNPQLTVRLPPKAEFTLPRASNQPITRELNSDQPARVVFARHRLPELGSHLVTTAAQIPTWLLAGPEISDADLARLADHEVEIWQANSPDPVQMVLEALQYLGGNRNPASRPATNLMVEGGSELLGSFASADAIDEIHVYLGGKLIGGAEAAGPVGGQGTSVLPPDGQFRRLAMDGFGDDVRVIYRRS